MAGAEPVDQLIERVKRCLVLLSGREKGSGFLIAPGMIATCAHVAGRVGDEVTIRWRGTELTGVVGHASALTRARVAPYPDMAVVVFTPPPSGHETVLLDEHLPAASAELVVVGWARGAYGPEPEITSGTFAHGVSGDMIRLTGGEIEPGMSGGPVLNTSTGGVCAFVKAARHTGQQAGGAAVPVRALRGIMDAAAYRELRRGNAGYHRRNRVWTGLADRLPGAAERRSERELRDILDRLPVLGGEEHLTAYLAVTSDLADPPSHPMHEYGDVVVELADRMRAPFPPVLAYVIDLSRAAGAPIAEALLVWARMSAGDDAAVRDEVDRRLGVVDPPEAAATGGATIPSVLVCVRRAGQNRKRYRCELWRFVSPGDITPIEVDDRDRSLEELLDHLRARLPGLAPGRPGDGRRPMFEFVLPAELLDEDLEHLPEAPDKPWSVLGRTNAVVVRDQERFDDEDRYLLDWRHRWGALDGQDAGNALTVVDCAEGRAHGKLQAWFQLAPEMATLVLPDSPRQAPLRAVLEVGLHTGIPVMVWRRNGCTGGHEPGSRDCPGGRLSAAVVAELSRAGRGDIPDRIKRLRNRAVAEDDLECGDDVVLLWDDPDRRLPRTPMTSPMGDRHAGG
ncbi:trypsin-like peptidase domain-containing protein [Actinoplanes sp. NPDC051851]|uniref:VMAP-C domain-containing protein n=1 Tax=Actinoplanes sp. NPDC051851 TaxID=3154753 RepID=UPI003445E0F7